MLFKQIEYPCPDTAFYLFIYLFIRRENKDEMEQMLKVWQDNSMCERYVFYIRCE